MFKLNFLYFVLCQLPLVCSLRTTELASFFFIPSHQVFMHIGKLPWSLLFSRLYSPSSFNLSSYNRCSCPFFVLMGLDSLQCAHVSPALGSPAVDPAHMDEWKGIITFSNLPAMLSLVQPRRLLSFAAKGGFLDHGQLGVHQDPKSSSAELLSSLYLCLGLLPDKGCMRCRWQSAGSGAAELASVRNPSLSVGQVGRQGPLGLQQGVSLMSLATLPAWLYDPSGGHQGVDLS